MERSGVERSGVANINGVFTQPANEELAAAIQPFPGKFIPFAAINPSYPDWESDLDVCHKQLGMKGVRVYPQYHDYKLADPRFEKLLEAAHARNMPVAFSLWLEDPRQRSWMDIGEERSGSGCGAHERFCPSCGRDFSTCSKWNWQAA